MKNIMKEQNFILQIFNYIASIHWILSKITPFNHWIMSKITYFYPWILAKINET